jgi:hypothetical protein
MSILLHTLPNDSVKVGRFITSGNQVSQNYHDPLSTSKQSVLCHHDDYRTVSKPSFVSTSKSLLSRLFGRTELKICMDPEHIDTSTLKDPNMWLNEAVHLPATQAWLKKAFERYNHIYMIVSMHVATNARIQVDLCYKKRAGERDDRITWLWENRCSWRDRSAIQKSGERDYLPCHSERNDLCMLMVYM